MNFSSMFAAAGIALGIVSGATTTVQVLPAHCVTITRSLAEGSSGADIQALQIFLGVKSSGYFGPLTRSALTKWQIANHIVVSASSAGAGQAGPKSRSVLRCSSTTIMPAPAPVRAAATSGATTLLSTSTPTTTTMVMPPTMGGGASGAPTGGGAGSISQCKSFTIPQPPASQCTTGSWIVVEDEAGCPAEWDCDDPNALQ